LTEPCGGSNELPNSCKRWESFNWLPEHLMKFSAPSVSWSLGADRQALSLQSGTSHVEMTTAVTQGKVKKCR
jgi:hypothetical protein